MDENGKKRIDLNSEIGMTRRDLLRRGAIVGGTLLWVAPAIQSLSPAAHAAMGRSPGPNACCYCYNGSDPFNPSPINPNTGTASECSTDGTAQSPRINREVCKHECLSILGYSGYQYMQAPAVFTSCGPAFGGCLAP
jgi:hypothetical protein